MAGGFECSLLELDVLGDALGVNVRQFPFEFPVHGEDIEERARFIGAVAQSLTGKGLLDDSAYAPALVDSVGLLTQGRWSIAVVGSAGTRSICARATCDRRHAVLAQQRGELVRFTTITPASLVRRAVELLPPVPAGPGRAVTITAPAVPVTAAQRRRAEDFSTNTFLESVRPAQRSAAGQAEAAEKILRRPRRGGGYFVVTERGRNGQDGSPSMLTWLDTDVGRYVLAVTVGQDGRRHGTLTPADLRQVGQHLSRLVSALL